MLIPCRPPGKRDAARDRHWLARIALGLASSVRAAGAEARERDFGSDHFVFGGSARVGKQVPGDLIAAGGNVDLDAEVKGDAVAAGARIFGGSDGQASHSSAVRRVAPAGAADSSCTGVVGRRGRRD